jgi:transcriptional regulator with XRE-family HTH domain
VAGLPALSRYSAPVEWTAATIRRFRDVGLCLTREKFAKELGFTKRTIGNAERGVHPPSLALRRALDQAWEKATDEQRARVHGITPAIPASNPTLESVELLRRTKASDLGAGTLEQLEELVEHLGAEYFATPPVEFRATVLSWRQYVAGLLEGTLTLRERGRLYRVGGWLSGLVAESSLALGEHAEPHCAAALSLAEDVDDRRLAGWVHGTQAQIALYTGDPRDAVGFARTGREIAPTGSASLVRTCTYEARASARMGDRAGVQAGLDAAEHAWNALSQPLVRSIYSLNASYLPYCTATTFVWLGDPANARLWATQAVELGDADPVSEPGARISARVDLAVALTQADEHDGAAAVGKEAMDIWVQRLTHPARKRIEELLAALRPFTEPCVVELRERWRWISS